MAEGVNPLSIVMAGDGVCRHLPLKISLDFSVVARQAICNAVLRRWTARKGWRETGPERGLFILQPNLFDPSERVKESSRRIVPVSFRAQRGISLCLNWLADIGFDYLSFALPYEKWGFGISYQNVLYGDIPAYDVNDNKLDTSYSPNDSLATVACAYRCRDDLSVGLSIKYVNSIIETVAATTVAGDAGMMYSVNKNFDLGLAVQNFGGTLTYVQDAGSSSSEC